MKQVLILSGLPASGKTTWAKRFIEDERKVGNAWKRVNRDSLRAMADFGFWDGKKTEKFIIQLEKTFLWDCMRSGYNCIIDDTNFNDVWMSELESLKEGGYEFNYSFKFFDAPVEECIQRDKKRDNPVGANVIWKMYNAHLKNKDVVEQDENLPKVVICDIDGTIAINDGHRKHFDYSKVFEDKPRHDIINMVDALVSGETGRDYELIFLSGREDSCFEDTKSWILENTELYKFSGNKIFMRKTEDYRKDYIIKRELWEEHIKDEYYVSYVVDDRLTCIRLWQSMGFTVLNVGPNYEF